MDIVTHSLFGALAGQALTKNPVAGKHHHDSLLPAKVAAGAAVFPDLDFILFPLDPLIFLADWHQSFTHSLVMAPIWAGLLTFLCVLFWRTLRQKWRMVYCAAVLGLVSHILLDVLTVYGTRLLYPISGQNFSLGTTFVIDPMATMVIAAGLYLSFINRAPRTFSLLTIAVLGLYVGLQWQLKIQAETQGFAALPVHPAEPVKTIAIPQPFSPFHWLVVVERQGAYSAALIDLAGQSRKLKRLDTFIPYLHLVTAYRHPSAADWQQFTLYGDDPETQSLIQEAWQQQALDKFRKFAVFPALYRIDHNATISCVWFTDLRYHISLTTPPFRYGMCREGLASEWKLYRLRYFTENTRHALG